LLNDADAPYPSIEKGERAQNNQSVVKVVVVVVLEQGYDLLVLELYNKFNRCALIVPDLVRS
jgi:hypothetical protein